MDSTLTSNRWPERARTGLRTWARDWALAGAGGLALSALLGWQIGTVTPLLIAHVGIWLLLGMILVLNTPQTGLTEQQRGPGPANRVTLARAAIATPLGALILAAAAAPETVVLLWVLGLAAAALILDGVDGAVARRTGSRTAFGARFDMELDAAIILALSILVWWMTAVGIWVVLIGAMRYLFLGVQRIWPWLGADLPPSRRRQAVCVLQTGVLLVALLPGLPPMAAIAVALAGLAALTGSFATDIHWLHRHRPGGST
ncbi:MULTISPECIES: CDP-alcohol phosphatidyltransferase family protein [unclassified Thioalkalivibrio]|uniref:CDP-alcohol phosphatidyltransferase family protein n=1 Tax=unclassified Thioalkalivibrio TaxID=2621013 RepID=UPI000371E1F6|nr:MULTISPECIES: CDP-alcohol phosphatidyltransferase family protein [unclassified Thioalkalivibrio]